MRVPDDLDFTPPRGRGCSRPPLGWRCGEDRSRAGWEPNLVEQAAIRDFACLRAEGWSWRRIAEQADRRHAWGAPWWPGSLRTVVLRACRGVDPKPA